MSANVTHGDAAIQRCQTWIAQNYEKPDAVARMVEQSGLPKRTFDRRFRAATGYSPLGYVQALRIEEAKQMLETGAQAIEEVAREVGYEDLTSFRRLFARLTGMTPGDYRRNFKLPDFIVRRHAKGEIRQQGEGARSQASRRPGELAARRQQRDSRPCHPALSGSSPGIPLTSSGRKWLWRWLARSKSSFAGRFASAMFCMARACD